MLHLGEYYHIYNRGAHKAHIFHDKEDYERFSALLFAGNDFTKLYVRWYSRDMWLNRKRDLLVEIHAYCLMPNHFHIALRNTVDAERFIHKICTAYTMYYNKKYDHSGTIFQGNYKSKHVDNDDYFRYLIQYIHLNPFDIDEPDLMKIAKPEYLEQAIKVSKKYMYSSFRDYSGEKRFENLILVEVRPPQLHNTNI